MWMSNEAWPDELKETSHVHPLDNQHMLAILLSDNQVDEQIDTIN